MSDRQRCVEILSADNVTILDLEGEIDIYTATEFKEALLQSIDGGAGRIVVDLTKVTLMDSTGLSVLVSGERRLRPRGGSLAVACDDRIRRVLTMTGLHNAFALCATRDEARRAAFSGRDASGAAPCARLALARRARRRQRRFAARMEAEDAEQTGDLEDAHDVGPAADDVQGAAARLEPLQPGDENAEAARVDEGHRGEVDDEAQCTCVDARHESLRELGGGVDVELALDHDHGQVANRPKQLDAKLRTVVHH